MGIPFTQFLLPRGIPRPIVINRPDEIEALAHRVIDAGGSFEIEMLTTGHISITCEVHSRDFPTVAHEICPNGPEVRKAVDAAVREAARELGVEGG